MRSTLYISLFILFAVDLCAKPDKDHGKVVAHTTFQNQIIRSVLEKKTLTDEMLLLGSEHDMSSHKYNSVSVKLNHVISHLKDKKAIIKSERTFILYSFYYLKSNYLINYQPDANFSEIFTSNSYDCVTGSALIALIYKRLDVKYQIIESYSHVCIHVQNDTLDILLEPTLKDGVYKTKKTIDEMIVKFKNERKDQVLALLNSSYVNTDTDNYLLNINFNQLMGIVYFNKAAQALLEKKYEMTLTYAEVAYTTYPSARTQGFLVYSLDNLLKDHSLDYKKKAYYYKKYKYLIDESLLVLK